MIDIISFIITILITLLNYVFFKPVFDSSSNLTSSIKVFNLIIHTPKLFFKMKISFLILSFFVSFIILKKLFSYIKPVSPTYSSNQNFSLLIGYSLSGEMVSIPEKSLYQNMLITGSIGCGKTSSAMYPFTKQLLAMDSKPGFLILDVKGNYYSEVIKFA